MRRRTTTAWSALLLVTGLIACDAAADTVEPLRTPAPAALSATTVRGTGTLTVDAVHFWDCVGEDIHNVFEVTYSYSSVTLPDGRIVYREHWPNERGIGTITGLTSGNVWRRDLQSSPYFRHAGGGTEVEAYVYNGRFVSETAPDIHVHEVFHFGTNARGELVVDRYDVTCTLR
jgi:hypothetical protein